MTARRHDGYDELFRAEYDSIVGAAFLVTGDRESAREVAQDAFAELYVRWRRVRRYDRPGAWVRRVAIRSAVKLRTREQRRPELSEKAARDRSAPHGDPDVGLDAALEGALAALSPQQRAAVALHYFQDLSVEDTAEAMGCAPSTASVHLHRARQRLADVLGEEVTVDAV